MNTNIPHDECVRIVEEFCKKLEDVTSPTFEKVYEIIHDTAEYIKTIEN